MRLKVIFLDIDNTLLDFDVAAQQSMEESFHKFGLPFRPEMMCIFNEENDKIWRRIEKKEISIADSKEHLVRPAYAVLDNFILRIIDVYEMPKWKQSLEEYIAEWKEETHE